MKDLKIIVCIKQVPDPEGPPSSFEINNETRKVCPIGIGPVINPFDENALELALQLKDKHGASVIAISLGKNLAKPVLSKALGVGADDLILLEDEHFDALDSDSIAYVLSFAIEKIGGYDLILSGRQASDWDFGQVGSIVAEILQIPSINIARRIEVEEGRVLVEKVKRTGYEVIKALMPALITVDSQAGDLRFPSLKTLIEVRKRALTSWGASELGVDLQKLETKIIHRLCSPQSRKRSCVFIGGESPEEKGENLAAILRKERKTTNKFIASS
jgi:electron transfer flavoprotein beta subunit